MKVDDKKIFRCGSLKITGQQLAILESKEGIKRIIACAGSGKTLVLTLSIADILNKGLCRPDEILAITFTRNAAENMRSRIKNEVKRKIDFQSINIFTFNAFGNYIINENSFLLGFGKNYRLISIPKSWQILYEIVRSYDFRNIFIGKDISKFIEQILKYIWRLKANLISPEDLENYIASCSNILTGFKSKSLQNEELKIVDYQKDLIGVYSSYENIKKKSNFIDYHDHVFLPYKLLLSDKRLSSLYKNRFKYIFVDEFQDTDVAQGYLISLLYNHGYNSLTIVGDDDQGIYSFRGACVENILRFNKWDFFSDYNVTDFYLTTNFRSGHNIVKAIDGVIAQNKERFNKELKPEFKKKYSEVLFFYGETHSDEVEEIVKNIKALLNNGFKLKDIAILARRKSFKSITSALDKNNINYELISSKGFFYEPEVLFIISWLMIVNNIADDIYLLYLLQSFRYKISDRDLFFLKRYDCKKGMLIDKWDNSSGSLLDGIISGSANPYVGSEVKKRLKEFLNEFNFYLKQANFLKLSELINLIFNHSGLEDELKSNLDRTSKIKIKNIETLIKISSDFELEKSGYSLESFILYLKDVAKTEEEDPDRVEFSASNSIKIMTVHAAKGLEFEAVFMPMLWKKDYFSRTSSDRFKIPALLRKDRVIYRQKGNFTSKKKFDDEIKRLTSEEERRVFYVGCSRAKKYLFLSYCRYERERDMKNKRKKLFEVLPFLLDILKNADVKPLNRKSTEFIEENTKRKLTNEAVKFDELLSCSNLKNKRKNRNNENIIKKFEIFNSDVLKEVEKILVKNIKKIKIPVKKNSIQYFNKYGINLNSNLQKETTWKPKRYFSLTELLSYMYCPKSYMWKYIYNIPEPFNERIEIGEKVHKTIEYITMEKYGNLVKNNLINSNIIENFVNDNLLKIKVFFDKNIQNYLINCNQAIKNYINNYLCSRLFYFKDIRMLMLEKLFYWNLNGIIISGKVDRLDIKNDDNLRIIDYKASAFSNKYENKNYINQLKSYTGAISSIFNINPNRISNFLLYLEDGSISELVFNEDEIKEFKETLLETVNKINSRDFNLKVTSKCKKKCAYNSMCYA